MSTRLLCSGISLAYVGSVYILPGGRPNINDVSVIWRRVVGVCVFSAVIVFNMGIDVPQWTAINKGVVKSVLKAVLSLNLLYAGSLLTKGFPSIKTGTKLEQWNSIKSLLVGPITEELVYRGVLISIYLDNGLTSDQALSENFLYFGLAHLHHGLMRWLNGEGAGKQICVQSFMHFVMTSLFGTYACYLVLRTGNIWPSVVSHLLCNLYGPPELSGTATYYFLTACSVAAFAYSLKYI